MSTTLIIKNSTVAGKVPSEGDLSRGELGLNLTDKKLYTKDANDDIVQIGDSVEVSDTAPTGSTVTSGSLWFNSTDGEGGGRLYIYYQDDDSAQWIDASPDMQMSEYWTRDGNDLKPVKQNDNVVVGVNAVTLSSSGTGAFTGKVSSASTASGDPGTTLVTKDFLSSSGAPTPTLQQVTSAGNTTANTIYTDGALEAGSYVKVEGSVSGIESTINNGTFSTTIKDGNTQPLYQGIKGVTTVFQVEYDGSITAAGDIKSGTINYNTSANQGVLLRDEGFIQINSPAVGTVFQVRSPASDAGAPGGLTYYVDSDGTVLTRGDVKIGGTLPSAPNIELNADGSITAKSTLQVRKSSSLFTEIKDESSVAERPLKLTVAYDSSVAGFQGGYALQVYDYATSKDVAAINSDGSALFTGGVNAKRAASGQTIYGGFLDNTYIYDIDTNSRLRLGTNISSAGGTKITLEGSDGSITAAGDVQVGGASYGNENGLILEKSGGVRATNDNPTYNLFRGYTKDNPTFTSAIYADGTVRIQGNGAGAGSLSIGGPTSAPNAELFNDGSATFSGIVKAKTDIKGGPNQNAATNADGFWLGQEGYLKIFHSTTQAHPWFQCFKNDGAGSHNKRIEFFDNGNATFAGTVTADAFQLTDGTPVTRGITALQALKVAAAAATDFASLQAAIATALADI